MPRPRIITTPRVSLKVDIPATTRDAIDDYGQRRGLSRTAATTLLLEQAIAADRAEHATT